MEEFLFAASNFGFPVVVASYLLIRIEPTLKNLQKSIALLTFVIAKQSEIDIKQAQQIIEFGRESEFYK
ncbi:MAG: YvrJ family protein [Clostridia bacterium]|nr:YvrJ family protein [Clostridia bacterium]